MSTMVVQERHLWLNLAEKKDVDKACFLDASISQAGLFGDTVEGFAQQFLAVQQQTEVIQHTCPGVMHHPPLPKGPGLSLPVAVGALLRPPASSRAAPLQAESIPRPAHRASRRRGASQPGPKSFRKFDEAVLLRATRRCWNLLFIRRRREQRRSFPWWRAGRRIFSFCSYFLVPTFSRKRNFIFLWVLRSMGRQCATSTTLTIGLSYC